MKEGNGYSFLKSVHCLSGLGIVRKNRRIPKYFSRRKEFVSNKAIIHRLISVLSLRSFNHEFTQFEKKKHYPWSDFKKNFPALLRN